MLRTALGDVAAPRIGREIAGHPYLTPRLRPLAVMLGHGIQTLQQCRVDVLLAFRVIHEHAASTFIKTTSSIDRAHAIR